MTSLTQGTNEDNQYIQVAEKHTQAMDAGRMIFERQYPAPQHRTVNIDNRFTIGILLVVVVAAIIVSASHTVPVFMRGTGAVTGIAAFIMLEFGLVALTYQHTRDKTIRHGTNENSFRWIKYAIVLTVFILLVANIYFVATERGFTHPVIDMFVVICIGVSAPALAFVCGEALALESVKAVLEQRHYDLEYEDALLDYNETFVQWWTARKSRWVAPLKVEKEAQSEAVQSVQPVQLDAGQKEKQKRETPAWKKAEAYFQLHPDTVDMPVRELEKLIGVSKSTIAAVLKVEKEAQSEDNGHE